MTIHRAGSLLAFAFLTASLLGCSSSTRALPVAPDGSATAGSGGGGGGGVGGSGGGAGGSDASGGSGGGNGGASCGCGDLAPHRGCCDGRCTNLQNDPLNCGACAVRCPVDKPFCGQGLCKQPPCERMGSCTDGSCCGTSCCAQGQLCCDLAGPVGNFPSCVTPTAEQPSCPLGCAPLCRSDRNAKKSITPVDTGEVLRKLGALSISTWSYRSEPDSIRHMGPMAQDFKQAFGLGDDDRVYHSVDAHGVALAAIQALERLTEGQRRRIDALERQNQALARRLQRLERQAAPDRR